MENDSANRLIRQFAKITLETFKELAGSGRELSIEALTAKLANRQDLYEAVRKHIDECIPVPEPTAPENGETESVRKQLDTLRSQRETLLSQIGENETRTRESISFYRTSLLTLIRVMDPDSADDDVSGSLRRIQELVRQDADIQSLDLEFAGLKELAFRQGIRAQSREKDAGGKGAFSLLSGFFKGSSKTAEGPDREAQEGRPEEGDACLARIGELLQDIIDKLKLNLDEGYLKRILQIEKDVRKASGYAEYESVRKDLLILFQEYLTSISGQREEAATFIREIGARLTEMEGFLFDSLNTAKEAHIAENRFSTMLEGEMEQLRGSVDYATTLAELKNAVVSKLNLIREAINKRRSEDLKRSQVMEKRVEALKSNLTSMRSRVSKVSERANELEKELMLDPLTRIYNRRAYDKRIKEEIFRYKRYHRVFSLLMFDVDLFKRINDQFGHAMGDLCLKEVVNRVRTVIRESDFLARYGGEEFIVLLPETGGEAALEAAEKIRKVVEKTEFIHRNRKIRITISVGVTEVDPSDEDHMPLFRRMDEAMYEAKQTGRNKVVRKVVG